MPLIIFAINDEDLINQLPDTDKIKSIKEIGDMTYKVILKMPKQNKKEYNYPTEITEAYKKGFIDGSMATGQQAEEIQAIKIAEAIEEGKKMKGSSWREGYERGLEEGKRLGREETGRIIKEEMDGLELETNKEFIACDELAIRIIKRLTLKNKDE